MGTRRRLRSLVQACTLGAALMLTGVTRAETTVPIDLQVELLRKVVRFERGFASRAGARVGVLLVVLPDSAASERAASQIAKALERSPEIAGKPIKLTVHRYASPSALKRSIAQESASIVYLTPGPDGELAAIASALEGVQVVTISTDGDQVDRGIVLGFELVSAHPKIDLNITQARKQGLDFDSDLLRLAKVVK
ncbi:MAG TPA: YfiR family protein [Polyangia bacterium]|nr:YfiR family protein [Polyangia bacterium]